MYIKTYYRVPYTVVSHVVYELPRHVDVNMHCKMTMYEKNGILHVVATRPLESEVGRALAEDKDGVE